VLPIILAAVALKAACVRLSALGTHRSENPLLHHVLVERGAGRVILAVTDLSAALIFCHLPAPLPLTDFQRKLAAIQWRQSALRFLVPLADLREAARTARGTVAITPGELLCGPLLLRRFTSPDIAEFPRILPALTSIAEGWSRREIHVGRVDVGALAAEAW
jgi:hypothetical protein